MSKLVSAEWNNLTEKEKKVYKKKETNDKLRYKKEREALAKQLESEAASQPAVEENLVSPTPAASTSSKSSKKSSKSSKSSGKSTTKSSSPSSYNVFQKKMRPQLKEQFPNLSTKEITSKLGESWRALSDTEKATYA